MKKIVSVLALAFLIFSAFPLVAFAQGDDELPTDVENVVATAYDSAVKVEWDAATDNEEVAGYQIHFGTSSVTDEGGVYESFAETGNVLEYIVTDLDNDTTYYFTVIAYDDAGNESERWAVEGVATPSEDAGSFEDDEAPQVMDAEALNREEVRIEFSEAVVIPNEDPEIAFSVENDDTFEPLEVMDVEFDDEDPLEKTVILSTEDQEEGATYKITVHIDIKDKAGNPIISGTSDTASFTGSGEEKPLEDEDGPELVSVEALDSKHVLINFDEEIDLDTIDPTLNFNIMSEEDPTETLTVFAIIITDNHDGMANAAAELTTSVQDEITYIVSVSGVTDLVGNEILPSMSSAMFTGIAGFDDDDDDDADDDDDVVVDDDDDDIDVTAPEEVAKFFAKKVFEADKFLVTLTWEIPAGSDVIEQLIYKSLDKGANYMKETSLASDVTSYEVKGLTPGEYWFKITQKDAAGNESEGKVFTVILSETGPEMLGLVLLSLGLGRIVTRRKRK